MPNAFKSHHVAVGTSNTLIVPTTGTVASGCETIVLTLRATNVDGANDATIDVQVVDTGGSPTSYIAKTMTVPADSSIELAGTSKLVLLHGDKIQALASAASDIEIFVSWLEIT